MIAILGRVGSGKSTLLRSIVRLLDPPPGTVYLDGRDIRLLPIAQVRGQIALVPQDPFLFADELGRNISYDNPTRATDEIWSAAEAADLEDTIERFPDHLKTLVGERRVTLSGGQKQRTSLARGLIRIRLYSVVFIMMMQLFAEMFTTHLSGGALSPCFSGTQHSDITGQYFAAIVNQAADIFRGSVYQYCIHAWDYLAYM